MTQHAAPGDRAVASVAVKVPQAQAFRIFTEEIDQWWRRGLRYRIARERSVVHLEPKLHGRLYELVGEGPGARTVETGRVITWEPPSRFVLEWRAVNFAADEKTEVEVLFAGRGESTLVTVTHRGWSQIRPDHPARHGAEVPAFIRSMGLWWGDLLTSLREHASAQGVSTSE